MDNEMTKADWQAKDERILKSGIMKSIHEGGRMPEGTIDLQKIWLKEMFDYSVSLIGFESMATTQEPREKVIGHPSTPVKSTAPMPQTRGTKGLEQTIVGIDQISQKEFKKKAGGTGIRYGIKDSEGAWYATFFKNHFDVAEEAKNSGHDVKIIFEVSEYMGKPQYTIQSIEQVGQ